MTFIQVNVVTHNY